MWSRLYLFTPDYNQTMIEITINVSDCVNTRPIDSIMFDTLSWNVVQLYFYFLFFWPHFTTCHSVFSTIFIHSGLLSNYDLDHYRCLWSWAYQSDWFNNVPHFESKCDEVNYFYFLFFLPLLTTCHSVVSFIFVHSGLLSTYDLQHYRCIQLCEY